jgi:Glutaredoxin-like domain (DUF836)
MITLTLYSRRDCHLCAAMAEELAPLLGDRARLSVVDISNDDDLERRYGLRIPVLTAGDEELSVYRLDSRRVERFLAGAS